MTIQQPDGTTLKSSASGHIKLKYLSSAATSAHIFPNLSVGLIGLPQLCDHDYSIQLTKSNITIYNPNGTIAITHPRTGPLWTLPLDISTSTIFSSPSLASSLGPPTITATQPAAQPVYNLFPVPSTAAGKCLFYQQCLSSPTKAALLNAADAGHLSRSFPILTPKFIRKHYVATTATAQAYLQRTRQNLRSHSSPTTAVPHSSQPSVTPSDTPTSLPLISLFVAADPTLQDFVQYTDATANFPRTNIHYIITYAEAINYIKVNAITDFTGATFLATYSAQVDEFTSANPNISFSPQIQVMDNMLTSDLRRYFHRKGITIQLVPPGNHRSNNAERAIQTFKKTLIATLASVHPDFPIAALSHLTPQIEFAINILRTSRLSPHLSAFENLYGPYNADRWPLVPIGTKGLVYVNSRDRPLGTFGPHGIIGYYVGRAIDHYGCYTMYIPETRTTRVTDSVYWLPHNPDFPRYERLPTNIFASAPPGFTHLPVTPEPLPVLEGAPADSIPASETASPTVPAPLSVSEGAHRPITPPPSPITVAAAPLTPLPNFTKDAKAFYSYYEKTIQGPNYAAWQDSMVRELTKLTQHFKDGLQLINPADVPPSHRNCPFLNPVTREKLDSATGAIIDLRTRLTWGKQPPSSNPSLNSSSVAASSVVKLLLNSAVSDPHAVLSTIDLDYFYYQTRRTSPEFARMRVRHIPPAARAMLGISHLTDADIIYFQANIAIPGQPDAGKLAQEGLIAHLTPYGYSMCRYTPCLFKHNTDTSIAFPVHVDDMLIKHDPRTSDYANLVAALTTKYSLKEKPIATSFCGIRIDLFRDTNNHSNDRLTLSIPGGVHKALTKLNFTPDSNPGSPNIYTPPTYTSDDQLERLDLSPPASTAERQLLLESVGYFRWYSPAVDPTLLPAISHLASQQASPTQNTMLELRRFLNYVYHHPNGSITYTPSDMQLHIHSDCSHHSESHSRSRTGIYIMCGQPTFSGLDAPYHVNGPIEVVSTILSHVTSSVAESEYGALFVAAQTACPLRQCLEDLGHPQNPCVITYDNQVAGNIAKGTAKLRRTRAIAKDYHWIQDRVAKGEFTLNWAPGKYNLGDFFSKSHPVHHFRDMRPLYVSDHAQLLVSPT